MSKESISEKTQKDIEILFSRLNALEVSTSDNFHKSIINILRTILEIQLHSVKELDHLKKAIDLLTLQIFKIENKN